MASPTARQIEGLKKFGVDIEKLGLRWDRYQCSSAIGYLKAEGYSSSEKWQRINLFKKFVAEWLGAHVHYEYDPNRKNVYLVTKVIVRDCQDIAIARRDAMVQHPHPFAVSIRLLEGTGGVTSRAVSVMSVTKVS